VATSRGRRHLVTAIEIGGDGVARQQVKGVAAKVVVVKGRWESTRTSSASWLKNSAPVRLENQTVGETNRRGGCSVVKAEAVARRTRHRVSTLPKGQHEAAGELRAAPGPARLTGNRADRKIRRGVRRKARGDPSGLRHRRTRMVTVESTHRCTRRREAKSQHVIAESPRPCGRQPRRVAEWGVEVS